MGNIAPGEVRLAVDSHYVAASLDRSPISRRQRYCRLYLASSRNGVSWNNHCSAFTCYTSYIRGSHGHIYTGSVHTAICLDAPNVPPVGDESRRDWLARPGPVIDGIMRTPLDFRGRTTTWMFLR